MADLEITSIDLATGIKPKNLVVPDMQVDVLLKNPAADLLKAIKDDKLVVQKMAGAAFAVLKAARDDFGEAVMDLDAGYIKRPPADKKEAEDRVATLNAMCKKIAEAQSDAASAAAEAEWDRYVKKNKDLTKFKVVFGLKMTLGTISVAASVVSAVMSMGVLAVTILGAAKTVAGMAADTYKFCRGMDKTEADIIATDADLAKSWTDPTLTAGKVGKELAAALGVPLVKSIGGLETLLDEYNAKNARKDHAADAMWAEAKKLMAAIKDAPDRVSPEQAATLKQLEGEVGNLLDQIGELSNVSKSNDLFYDVYSARCETYQEMEGGKLGKTAAGTNALVLLAGIASTADTIVSIAMKL